MRSEIIRVRVIFYFFQHCSPHLQQASYLERGLCLCAAIRFDAGEMLVVELIELVELCCSLGRLGLNLNPCLPILGSREEIPKDLLPGFLF